MSDHTCEVCGKSFNWGEDADSHFAVAAANQTCAENAYWKLRGHMQADHPDYGHRCGRRNDLFARDDGGKDWWGKRDDYRACSYCGSMHPEDLFAAIEAGNCQITGTDKNYKIYVDAPTRLLPGKAIYMSSTHEFAGGVLLTKELCEEHDLDSYAREHYVGRWVKIEPRSQRAHLKFYYQHFDHAQQDRFIELYNERKLPLEPQFGLYVKPYFTKVVTAA
jgi:hypothetical protein